MALTANFVSNLGSNCTVAYVTDAGVTITSGQTVNASYAVPAVNWYYLAVINRALTAAETTRLSNWLQSHRAASINQTIAVWGDSWAAGSGSSLDSTRWVNQIQTMFVRRQDVYEGGVGGNSTSDELTRVNADTLFPHARFVFVDKINTSTGETPAMWESNVAQILQHPTGNVLVLSGPTGTGEGIGTQAYNDTQTINAWLAANYPNNYFDLRGYLISSGLAAAGITPTTSDNSDIASDTIPGSLLADGVHLNDAGQKVMAQKVHDVMVAKGWGI
jgi:lysophospholipase L1-like esterase